MSSYLNSGMRVLVEEGQAVVHASNALSESFQTACEWLHTTEGRVLCCGIGKSGHIARKTAGTLSSTGTPSGFLHAAEAVHGDLGMVTNRDTVILYTQSGETDEIVRLFPALKAIGAKTIVITGRPDSSAARLADLVLETGVSHEACPNNLAPTTSTTVMLALSDALAIAVMEGRGFSREDFARFHPSGSLGKRLLLTVADVMRTGPDLALASPDTPVLEMMARITRAGAGAACIVNEYGTLAGFVSDGDLRRYFLKESNPSEDTASKLMNTTVSTIGPELLAIEALEVFQNFPRKIGEMPVVDEQNRVLGLLMVKDLLRSGIL
ncbi:MAG: KpsF/GutQ family sugar-phosphate isomerase [Armatimonadetes bacterium]|nr:KpsF/GutQ family sugar-phosphate isomerase [Armatimonadota bacterium]